MGRRKLPSIPTQRAEKVSETPPAPVFLTSSAPVVSPSSDRQYHAQDPRAYSQPASRAASLSNLSLPSSSSAAHCRTVYSAILPGAAIVNAKPKLLLRQTTSAAAGDRSSVLGQTSGTKMPNPLARVLLKKELKEVLERRRESLEACEIEANQRQYIVHRMLITGLLPEYRSVDIDNIPNVIPCLLPIELISGARVVPSEVPSTTTSVTTTSVPERSSVLPSSSSIQSSTQEVGISTDDFCLEPKLRSVGVQSESSFATATTYTAIPSSIYHTTTASLRHHMKHDQFDPFSINTDSAAVLQPRFQSTETQTNGITTYEVHSNQLSSRRHRSSASNIFSSSEPNLLESTAKYFAEYDRQLREHGRRLKNRFAFSDDDPVNRETRKQRVMDELAQRKEKISSMIDLYSRPSFPITHPTSDYSSIVPHYGSLPRIDFPATRSPRSNRRDHISRNRSRSSFGYGSLPRNYERCTERNYGDSRNDYYQSLPIPAGRYEALSRSWHNVNPTTVEDPILDSRTRLYATRSTNYLDPWLSYPESNVSFGRPLMKAAYDDLYRAQYMPSARAQNFYGPQGLPHTDIISQYANYLSNQFITDQQKLMSGYPAEELMYLNQAKKRPYSVPRYRSSTASGQALPMINYEDPLPSMEVDSACLHPNQPIQQPIIPDPYINFPSYAQSNHNEMWPWCQQLPYANSSALDNNAALPYHYPNHFSQTPNTLPGASPLLGQVYSRNDANYGSRPSHYATEYGNYYRDRAAHQLPDSSNRNYAVRSHYPYIPYSTQYHAGNRYLNVGEQSYSPNQPSTFMDNYPPISQQPSHAIRAWSNGNIPVNSYDAVYPKEDALNRMYTTLSYQRSMRPQHYGNGATSLMYS
ncbi:unnamed protein product [Cercopithifilaria johnstoni]|uniref:Uncharacterized protein n=1 Tax=Cercopithifilaria johnstoni TaxID=2874296 RepID=A0A8J2M8J2_9BILA|nr:unnamed protein product [Cercopithifilaria johnstoni]